MKDTLYALSFLLALVVVPFFISIGTAWSVLHFTDTGLLVGGGEITQIADDQTAEKAMVQCSYFTAAGFVERAVEHKKYGYKGQHNCPWRINISA